MNILCINHEYPPIGGGGATACKNLTERYCKNGHTVTVLTSGFMDLQGELIENSVHIIRVNSKRKYQDHSSFKEMLSFLFAAYKKLNVLIKQEKFDVAHIFFGIPSGPLGIYLKKCKHIPYIIRLGGGDIPGAQKRFDKFYKVIAPFLKWIWHEAETVVANSEGLLIRAQKFYKNANFEIISNGINIDKRLLETHKKEEDIINICTVARLLPNKGIQHVLRILPNISKELDGKIQYTIIGDGSYREELEGIIKELHIESIVRITGYVTHDKVISLLQENDIFVFPSYHEGMPNAVLEAMSMGLPIVMTNCEGSQELVDENGIVVALNDRLEENLQNAIVEISENQELRLRMSNESKRRVEKYFTWDEKAEEYLSLMEKAIEVGFERKGINN